MTITLENPWLQLIFDPAESGSWSLQGIQANAPLIHQARLDVRARRGGSMPPWRQADISAPQRSDSPHGPLTWVDLRFAPIEDGLAYRITFAMPETQPFLLWRIVVQNQGSAPAQIERLELLKEAQVSFPMRTGNASPRLAFLSNGWQSWSYSGVYAANEQQRRTRLRLFQGPPNVNPQTPHTRRRGCFSSDMFAVLGDRTSRSAILVGFLSQRQHFGSVEARLTGAVPLLRLWANGDNVLLEPGAEISTDWACLNLLHVDEADPLGAYLEAVAREHALPAGQRLVPTGWCSWYQFFQNVTAVDIRQNIQAIQEQRSALPLDVFQIDDGFESQVGDWFSFKATFPDSVAPLAVEIRRAGMIPGLWLAPFIVHPQSRLMQEHPDWLLRSRLNRPVNAGFLWNTFTTALDMTHPSAMAYVEEVISTAVHRWGFPYLKLDFLFAAALPGRRRDPRQTRAQVLRSALEAVRRAAGETTLLLGCGCPLGTAIGLVDAMRISADVDVRWTPAFHGIRAFFHSEPHMPATRNALQNVLVRAPLHRRWWINDPDCLLLRPETELTLAELQTHASVVALSGGMLLLSDHLPNLPPERLRVAQSLLPLIGQAPRLIDWLDAHTPSRLRLDLQNDSGCWHLLALINWDDHPREFELNLEEYQLNGDGEYHLREFWSGLAGVTHRGRFPLGVLPAHGTALLALRPRQPDAPQYLGSDLHISQGLEVTSWQQTADELNFGVERPGGVYGRVYLHLPLPPSQVQVNQRPVQLENCPEGYALNLAVNGKASVQLTWKH